LTLRSQLYAILEKAPEDRSNRLARWSYICDVSIICLIVLNLFAVVLETVQTLSSRFGAVFCCFETLSVAVFTIEYFLRLWTCVEAKEGPSPLRTRLRYSITWLALVDLAAILPFYLPMFIAIDLRFLRALRLLRLLRLIKIGRYSVALQTLAAVLRSKREQMIVAVCAVILLLLVASSIMFYVENEAQPEAFSSIPAAMWWGVCTLTTVGYGDVYPVTPLGKIVAAMIAILAIGLFGLPAGILASGFTEEIESRAEEAAVCPHCGRCITETPTGNGMPDEAPEDSGDSGA